MSFSALIIPKKSLSIENNSTGIVNNHSFISNPKNIFDWVFINNKQCYPGEVYFKSKEDNSWYLASTITSEHAEVCGVVENVILSPSGSLIKLVYSGKIELPLDVSLKEGSVYFLNTSSLYSNTNNGPENFRNLTINEPLISKPILVATSTNSAIVKNYRGFANTSEIESPSNIITDLIGTQSVDKCCDCSCISSSVVFSPYIECKIDVSSSLRAPGFIPTLSPKIYVHPTVLDFGTASIELTSSISRSFTIENIGNSALIISRFDFPSEFDPINPPTFILNPHQSQSIELSITQSSIISSSTYHTFPSNLIIHSNDQSQSLSVVNLVAYDIAPAPILPSAPLFDGPIYDIKIRDDGKYYVAGTFSTASGSQANGLVRFNADGTIDNSFSVGAGYLGSYSDFTQGRVGVSTVELADDGGVYICSRLDMLFGNYQSVSSYAKSINPSVTIQSIFSSSFDTSTIYSTNDISVYLDFSKQFSYPYTYAYESDQSTQTKSEFQSNFGNPYATLTLDVNNTTNILYDPSLINAYSSYYDPSSNTSYWTAVMTMTSNIETLSDPNSTGTFNITVNCLTRPGNSNFTGAWNGVTLSGGYIISFDNDWTNVGGNDWTISGTYQAYDTSITLQLMLENDYNYTPNNPDYHSVAISDFHTYYGNPDVTMSFDGVVTDYIPYDDYNLQVYQNSPGGDYNTDLSYSTTPQTKVSFTTGTFDITVRATNPPNQMSYNGFTVTSGGTWINNGNGTWTNSGTYTVDQSGVNGSELVTQQFLTDYGNISGSITLNSHTTNYSYSPSDLIITNPNGDNMWYATLTISSATQTLSPNLSYSYNIQFSSIKPPLITNIEVASISSGNIWYSNGTNSWINSGTILTPNSTTVTSTVSGMVIKLLPDGSPDFNFTPLATSGYGYDCLTLINNPSYLWTITWTDLRQWDKSTGQLIREIGRGVNSHYLSKATGYSSEAFWELRRPDGNNSMYLRSGLTGDVLFEPGADSCCFQAIPIPVYPSFPNGGIIAMNTMGGGWDNGSTNTSAVNGSSVNNTYYGLIGNGSTYTSIPGWNTSGTETFVTWHCAPISFSTVNGGRWYMSSFQQFTFRGTQYPANTLLRITTTCSLDSTFTPWKSPSNGNIWAAVEHPVLGLLVGGEFTDYFKILSA